MKAQTGVLVYFSPTGTTHRIVEAIADGLKVSITRSINLTGLEGLEEKDFFLQEDAVIIGVPVYEERIPKAALPILQKLKGTGQAAVLVAVYGNIGHGVTLRELKTLTKQINLTTIAAAAFIGEHSFSHAEVPVAQGRPDIKDLIKAREFGAKVLEKIGNINDLASAPDIDIPGHLPLMARIMPENSARMFTYDPEVNRTLCKQCNICCKVCPVSAIDSETLQIDSKRCIRCFACVRKCRKGARQIKLKKKLIVSTFLKNNSIHRKEAEYFL